MIPTKAARYIVWASSSRCTCVTLQGLWCRRQNNSSNFKGTWHTLDPRIISSYSVCRSRPRPCTWSESLVTTLKNEQQEKIMKTKTWCQKEKQSYLIVHKIAAVQRKKVLFRSSDENSCICSYRRVKKKKKKNHVSFFQYCAALIPTKTRQSLPTSPP